MDLHITLSHKAVDLFITLTAILALIYSGRYGMARALAVFVRPSSQEKWEEESAMRPSNAGIRPLRFCFQQCDRSQKCDIVCHRLEKRSA